MDEILNIYLYIIEIWNAKLCDLIFQIFLLANIPKKIVVPIGGNRLMEKEWFCGIKSKKIINLQELIGYWTLKKEIPYIYCVHYLA